MSRDVTSVATLIVSFAVFWATAGGLAEELSTFLPYCFTAWLTPGVEVGDLLLGFVEQGIMVVLRGVGPLMAATVGVSVGITFFQTKLLVTKELIKPKLSKLNPISGLKGLFSMQKVIEALKSLLKIAILLIIIYLSVRDLILESGRYLYAEVPTAANSLLEVSWSMVFKVIIAFGIIAAADFFYQRWKFERDMRMSKDEIKEEFKQTEGDPKVKSRIRGVQRSMSMRRMMQQVPKADVVIRNPTHYAVALRYTPDVDPAPIVLAMGQDELALRIIRIAEANQVKVIENVPLARALYAECELNKQIPPQLYGAVAEVLVYIFRLDENKRIVK